MAPVFCDRCGDAVGEGYDPLDELAQLDALWKRLTLKRYDLKRKINQFYSLIVRQLPPDIMSTVFEFCLPDFADFHLSPSNFPLSLGAICTYWREIAWSTPCLWSSLVVCLKPHTAIVQEWLARSGQLPLSIRILSPSRKPNKCRQVVLALAEIINQYSNRWSDLDLCIPRSFYHFFYAIDNHAPILRSIRFHSSYTDDTQNFQLTCPRLERADLFSFQIGGTDIQWDNLTHLILEQTSISDSFLIMSKTPRLIFFQNSHPRYNIGVPSLPPVILESLRILQIITDGYSDNFLDYLITPCLEELNLSEYPAPMDYITSFFKRSACSLRYFSVTFNLSRYFEEFMSLLPLIPSLKTLSITGYPYHASEDDSRNILQLVAKVVSSQSTTIQRRLLPNLEALEYTGQLCLCPGNYAELFPLPPTDDAVHGPLRLLKLDLSPIARIPKNIISYILSLTEQGIIVNVLSGSEDILKSSMDYYRNKEEFLCRDWVDNFDSSLMQDFGVPNRNVEY